MPNDLQTIDLKGVEIFQSGVWNGDSYEVGDLQAMCDAFGKVGFDPPVKAGHEEGQEQGAEVRRKVFGSPALGYVKRIYLSGKKLLADITGVPARFGRLIGAGAYKRISAEIYWQYKDESSGKQWPRVLKAVSFLGADIPALTSLSAVESLYKRAESGVLTYAEGKNQVRVYDRDYCCGDTVSSGMNGLSLAEYLIRYPRKPKDDAGYDLGDGEDYCSDCKFWIPGMNACTLVEGNIEARYTCDFFEAFAPLEVQAAPSGYATSREFKNYTIEKRGRQWCLVAKSTGKTLGCHGSEEEAVAQERAVEANKHSNAKNNADSRSVWVTVSEMESLCPPCAENMRKKNYSKVKVFVAASKPSDNADMMDGAMTGMCDKFGDAEGFAGRCASWAKENGTEDPEGFCKDIQSKCYEITQEARIASEGKGGHTMPDKDDGKVASFDKEAGAKILAQVDEKIAVYEKKLEAKDQALEAANKRTEELEKRLAATEQEKRHDGIRAFLKEQKVAGKIGDAEIPRAEAILLSLSETRTVKYSQDGQDEEKTEVQAFKEFLTKRPSLFVEKSNDEGAEDNLAEASSSKYADPGAESDKRVQAYKKENPDATLRDAYKAVWDKDPRLFKAWQSSRN